MLGFGAIQPAVLRKADGTLVAFMRENGFTETIRRAESRDDGVSWGPVTSAGLPNPGSGLDGVRLRNGRWLLVYNDTTNGRNSLAVSLSADEGATWTVTRRLEDRPSGSYHYPTVIQTKDDRIHVVYSTFTDDGKSMQHAEFDEAWVSGR
jgi:predicted neuraminidase